MRSFEVKLALLPDTVKLSSEPSDEVCEQLAATQSIGEADARYRMWARILNCFSTLRVIRILSALAVERTAASLQLWVKHGKPV